MFSFDKNPKKKNKTKSKLLFIGHWLLALAQLMKDSFTNLKSASQSLRSFFFFFLHFNQCDKRHWLLSQLFWFYRIFLPSKILLSICIFILCVYETVAVYINLLDIMLPRRILLFKFFPYQKNRTKTILTGAVVKENMLKWFLLW